MIGQLLNGLYQVIEVLGTGGFSKTYIAQDNHRPGNPKCVVKHLKPASSDANFLVNARCLFQVEAKTLEKLGCHDQIPQLLDYFEADQEFYLVQELIVGHPLSAELQPGHRWQESQVLELLQQVLSILEFVHSHGVIHRDVKPDNLIRRQQDNKLVLIDFGTVKQVRTQLVTAQGQMSATIAIGTHGYMPPEQGQGKPHPNSDIYALGIIGIQALTGLNPLEFLEDLDTGEILHQAQISDQLAAVLTKMVSYHFKDRYQSAIEVQQALQQLSSGYTPTPSATPLGYPPTQIAPAPGGTPLQPSNLPQPPVPSPPVPSVSPSGQNTILNSRGSQPATNSPNRLLPVIGTGMAALVITFGVALAIKNRPKPVITANSNGKNTNSQPTTSTPTPNHVEPPVSQLNHQSAS